jgi:Zinc-binding
VLVNLNSFTPLYSSEGLKSLRLSKVQTIPTFLEYQLKAGFPANSPAMPASHKMLKNKEQKANRALGVGDEQGRMPSRVKVAETMGRCSICSTEIRMTKKNIEARAHYDSRHPTSTFAICFPGHFDPTIVVVEPEKEAGVVADVAVKPAAPVVPKKKPAQDLSFLDAALDTKGKKK